MAIKVTQDKNRFFEMNTLKFFLSESTIPCLDIWYVASPSGPLSRFLKIMPLWLKMVLPRRPHVLHGIYLYRENILSETTRPKALIFGK